MTLQEMQAEIKRLDARLRRYELEEKRPLPLLAFDIAIWMYLALLEQWSFEMALVSEEGDFSFCDLRWSIHGRPVIDVARFDKWLKGTHYDDYPDGMSMTEAVRKFYGAEADEWLTKHVS